MTPKENKNISYTQINKKGEIEHVEIEKRFRKKQGKFTIPAAYYNLGFYLAIPLIGAVFIGRYLDRKFQTDGLITVLFIVFGTISVFYNLYKLYKEDGSTYKH